MNSFTASQNAKVANLVGNANIEDDSSTSLQNGVQISQGTQIIVPQGSEITLILADGSEQIISGTPNDEITEVIDDDFTPAPIITTEEEGNSDRSLDFDNQAPKVSIASTAAEPTKNNQSTITFQFSEDVTGFTKTDINVTNGTLSHLIQIDGDIWTAMFTPYPDSNQTAEISGNVLDNDSDPDDVLIVESFTMAGDTTTYQTETSVTIEGGTLLLEQSGNYSFAPADNWNGSLPVITYITNTG